MATTEKNVLMRSKDSAGNSILYYPITKADNVDGLDAYVGSEVAANVVNPDWNQNDPTAKDYIKNRIIYRDVLYADVLIASGTLPEDTSGELTINNEFFNGFVVGETYTVTIDGTVEECKTIRVEGTVTVIAWSGANSITDLMNMTDGFYVGYMTDDTSAIMMAAAMGSYSGKTISIEGPIVNIKKLPESLLPDSVATVEYTGALGNAAFEAAKAYTDEQLDSLRNEFSDVKTYIDNGDATTLSSAKAYVDEQLAAQSPASQVQFITWGADD